VNVSRSHERPEQHGASDVPPQLAPFVPHDEGRPQVPDVQTEPGVQSVESTQGEPSGCATHVPPWHRA
jgi:hypothetical protein